MADDPTIALARPAVVSPGDCISPTIAMETAEVLAIAR
jgi:hypothetical protein